MKATITGVCTSAALMFNLMITSGCGDSTPPSAVAVEPEAAAVVTSPDAYAPRLVVPKKLPEDPSVPMLIMMMENSITPSTSEVSISLYPGAQLMTAMGAMVMTSNGEKMASFPSMTLLSADETSEIVAFYKERLSGWRYQEFVGTHSFWNGDEGSNPLDITGQFSLVVLAPVSETDSVRAIWPDVRTRIDLRYEPPTH